jgi:hypothetical protein
VPSPSTMHSAFSAPDSGFKKTHGDQSLVREFHQSIPLIPSINTPPLNFR